MTALPVAACPTEAELEFDRQVDALAMTGLPERARPRRGAASAPWLEPLRDLLPAAGARRHRHPVRRGGARTCPSSPVLESVHTVGGAGLHDDGRRRPGALPAAAGARGAGRPVPAARRRPGRRTPSNVPPAEVLPRLTAAGRSPLTIAEGLAVLVSDPGVLRGRNCFSLLGLAGGGQAGAGAVGQRPPAAAGLVLPGRAAHLARLGLLRRPARRAVAGADTRAAPVSGSGRACLRMAFDRPEPTGPDDDEGLVDGAATDCSAPRPAPASASSR